MFFWLTFLTPALLVGSLQDSKVQENVQLTNHTTTPPHHTIGIWNFIPNCWTQWFDRDDPTGSGDHETLAELRTENPGKICDTPLLIQVQTTGGAPASSTGEVFYKFDTVTGFVCRNSDQKPLCKCEDYRVRFRCPPRFCSSFHHEVSSISLTAAPPATKPLDIAIPITRTLATKTLATKTLATKTFATKTFATKTFATKTFATKTFATKTFATKTLATKTHATKTFATRTFATLGHVTKPPPTTEPIQTFESTTNTRHTIHTKPPVCWTQWFDRDDPSGSGDWETLLSLHLQHPGKICTSPLQIEARTTLGQPMSSTGDVISKCDTVTGFICKNSDQKKGLCSDYEVRFRCPLEFCAPPPPCWTEWFDRDDPSGTGDWETLQELRFQYPGRICFKPLQIQVQTTAGLPPSSTGDSIYKSDTVTGFICRNRDQKKGDCHDYRVRFMCPHKFCVLSSCWTRWFDRDDPSGSGDWETLASLHITYPEQICQTPLQIQGQTTTGLPASASGNVLAAYDTTVGLICKNCDQRKGVMCHDFQVRFLCPPDFCRPKECYTNWFDRDDPSGTGDWETLFALRAEFPGLICPAPLQIQVQTITGYSVAATGNIITAADVATGFICQNSAQPSGLCHDFKVRFVCPVDFCLQKVCWTQWYDRDDPSGTGDWELLSYLRKNHPDEICETPLYIDVRTVDTNQPITATGQTPYIYSPTQGFACINKEQRDRRCRDYKVRFGCPCKCIVDID